MRALACISLLILAAGGGAVAQRKPAPRKPAPTKPMAFQPGTLELAPGESLRVELFVPSPTGRRHDGRLTLTPSSGLAVQPHPAWKDSVPPWGAKTYPLVKAEKHAEGPGTIDAELTGGGQALLDVRVSKPEIEPIPGKFKLTVRVKNPFSGRPLHGRIQASNPDRFLQTITAREFKIPPGGSGEVVFPLPGAAPVQGEQYEFTLTMQTYQGYAEKKVYRLEFPSTARPFPDVPPR